MENTLENINKASLRFLEPLALDEVYRTIVEEAIKLVHAEYGSIHLEQEGELQRIYSSSEHLQHIQVRKRGFTYTVFKTQKPTLLDGKTVANMHPGVQELDSVKSVILIPLAYKKQSIGVLTVQSLHEERFTQKELHILKLFGLMASMAIRKAQLYDETKNALETRDLFISLASHELRTPLTSINGYIQLLYSKLGKGDSQEAKWIRELYDESGRLTNLVKELLEINRIKQGQLQFNLRECSLRDVVNQAIGRLKFVHPEREIIFANKIDGTSDMIIGDPDKLLQMMSAFLSNAIKFSPIDTSIHISLIRKSKYLIITIQDQGEGIEQADLPHIFEEFYKAPHNHREGMGIGLILAKHIITYHKGEVHVTSAPQKGTTIEVQFPRIDV